MWHRVPKETRSHIDELLKSKKEKLEIKNDRDYLINGTEPDKMYNYYCLVCKYEECLVIGISVSGNTKEVINSLKEASNRGSSIVLITSKQDEEMKTYCDEILFIAVKEHLENRKAISPQFPVLVIVDIFYSHFLQSDRLRKEELHSNTINALYNE